jgi:N-acetylglutamate synthase-like GNAT family acetyltransferase
MPHKIQIIQAIESDTDDVKNLLIENHQKPSTVIDSNSIYFLAKANGKLIGTIGAEITGTSALIRSTAVLSAWRSKGIAADLVDTLFARLKSDNITDLYLFSRDSGKYWQKFGFVQCKVEEVVDRLPNVPQVVGYVNDGSIWSDVAWCCKVANS